jgi:thioredoxin 1
MENKFNEIINSDKPTLVDFHATWCGPCKTMNPIIEQTKNILGDKATIIKVDIDSNKPAAMKYGVRSVPTLILFKNGEIVWRQAGVTQSKVLVDKVNQII